MILRYTYDSTFTKSNVELLNKSLQKFKKHDIFFIQNNQKYDLILSIQSKNEMLRHPDIGKEAMKEFSYTIYSKPIQIIILKENWEALPLHRGCEFKTLKNYRIALLNHELAHAVGYAHVNCPKPGLPADTRQQPTLSLGGCLPSTEVIFYPGLKEKD